jgi:hypothetical protein
MGALLGPCCAVNMRNAESRRLAMTGIQEELEAAKNAAEDWVDALMRWLGWHDRQKVYLALVSGLHGLRDSLPREDHLMKLFTRSRKLDQSRFLIRG